MSPERIQAERDYLRRWVKLLISVRRLSDGLDPNEADEWAEAIVRSRLERLPVRHETEAAHA